MFATISNENATKIATHPNRNNCSCLNLVYLRKVFKFMLTNEIELDWPANQKRNRKTSLRRSKRYSDAYVTPAVIRIFELNSLFLFQKMSYYVMTIIT